MLEQALVASRATGDRLAEGWTLARMALAAWFLGDYETAFEYAAEALRLSEAGGDRWGTAWAQHLLAVLCCHRDPRDPAIECLQTACAATWRELGSRRDLVYVLYARAENRIRTERAGLAEPILREALPIALELGDQFGIVTGLMHWASLTLATGGSDRTAHLLGSVLAAQDAGVLTLSPLYVGWHRRQRDRCVAELGLEAAEAAVSAGRALTLDRAVDYALGQR